jgi:nucleolar pre-ribosomal-associated protein 2
MSANVEQREKTYLQNAVTLLREGCQSDSLFNRHGQLALLKAAVSVLRDSSALDDLDPSLERPIATLFDTSMRAVARLSPQKLSNHDTMRASAAATSFVCLSVMNMAFLVKDRVIAEGLLAKISSRVPELIAASDTLVNLGLRAGWDMRVALAKHFSVDSSALLDGSLSNLLGADTGEPSSATAGSGADQDTALDYVSAVIQTTSEESRLELAQRLVAQADEGSNSLGQLVVMHELVQHIRGMSRPRRLLLF